MKYTKSLAAVCMATVISVMACSKDDNNDLNDQDRTFLTQASISNNAEINAATLASTKAVTPEVKAFAQHMIMEHGMAQNDLKNLGNSVGFAVKDTVDPAHLQMMTMLNSMNGTMFDSAYIHGQVADHDMTIANFQTELSNGRHSDVKNYVNTYLPHIQMHRQSADSIAKAFFAE